MLKVIGAGLPRTGTTSMKAALERLGFGPCYHMFEIFTNPDHVDRWLPVAAGGDVDWARVFDGYQSTQDWPASHFWRELAGAYPEAKVVLTVRDPHTWYPSFRALLMRGAPAAPGQPATQIPAPIERMRPVLNLVGQAYFGSGWSVGDEVPPEEVAVDVFRRHARTVQDTIEPDRLLVFDVREGWAPLCSFLGVAVPEGEPFPHLNDADWIQRALQTLQSEGRMPSPFERPD